MPISAPRHEFKDHASSIYEDDQASDYGSSHGVAYNDFPSHQGRPAMNGYHGQSGHGLDFISKDDFKDGPADNMTGHLLYESAMLDSQSYAILQMSEVDELKKEQTRVASRLDAAARKLVLESKVKDAAQNLQRLYSAGNKHRPDTPQSPTSPHRSRTSLLSGRGRDSSGSLNGAHGSHSQSAHQAQDELTMSIKRVDELNETIKSLQDRRAMIDRKLLSHTAAVLAEQASRATRSNRTANFNPHDDDSDSYSPDAFDGIRDILHGKRVEPPVSRKSEEELFAVHDRLQNLNERMRRSIEEVTRARGRSFNPDISEPEASNGEITAKIEARIAQLERAFDSLNNEHAANLQDAEETHAKTSVQSKKSADYETTVSGLWGIIQSDNRTRSTSGPPSPLGEDFSLAAFSSRVQNLFDRAQSANEQHEILRRQIQQQRELNGRSDAEKDAQLTDLQTRNDEIIKEKSQLQEQLTVMVNKHAQLETEASHSQAELTKVMTEFESLHGAVEARQKERDEMAVQLQALKRNADAAQAGQKERDEMAAQLQTLQNTQKERDEMAVQLQTLHKTQQERDEMAAQLQTMKKNADAAESLESEVVRLTTELTMAKAELDGAYGTRAERKKEAEAANGDRTKALEQELHEMTTEFQELTRESVEMEKEREQLEGLIDSFRERCEVLETQLTEEKAKWIGIQNSSGSEASIRENTSIAVMRQEFKKMMREVRVEGLKALKTEQEERRRLESEVRRLRQGHGPMSLKPESRNPSNPSSA